MPTPPTAPESVAEDQDIAFLGLDSAALWTAVLKLRETCEQLRGRVADLEDR